MSHTRLDIRKSVRVIDDTIPGAWSVPSASIIGGLPSIWQGLELIVEDWTREVAALWPPGNGDMTDAVVAFETLDAIRPRFLVCLFGYITFFLMLEDGYERVYRDLNAVNRDCGLNLKHPIPPKKPDYIDVLVRVRNTSVAHWGGTGQGMGATGPLDASAGQDLGVHFGQDEKGSWDLRNLQFGAIGRLKTDPVTGIEIRSGERVTLPLAETHEICTDYLRQFDEACVDYLLLVKGGMPRCVGGREYF